MMIPDADTKTSATLLRHRIHKFGLVLNVVIALAVTLHAQNAFAEKIKLAVFPVSDTMDLKKHQRDYLYDVIREAASASAGSYIVLIHEQKIHSAVKKNKGQCDEECAFKAASASDARVALIVELHKHGDQVLGVVKLLDTKENVLLTVKRFFSDTLQGAEQELQGAVMFVLSAQFLPIDETDRRALQVEQQNIPMNYSRTQNDTVANQPATPPPPPEKQDDPKATPEYSYSNKDISQPSEPRRPRAYLITAIITGTVGVGLLAAGALFGVQAAKEQDSYNDIEYNRALLEYDWDTLSEGDFLIKYNRDIKEYSHDEVLRVYDIHSENMAIVNDTIKQNVILAVVMGTLGVTAATVSAVTTIKYIKARKKAKSSAQLQLTPLLSPKMSGLFLSGQF